jgi:hypothetical protein
MAGLKVAAVTFLILDLAAAVAGAAPALFREPLFPSASSKAAVLSALQLPKDLELPGTEYVEPKFRTGDTSRSCCCTRTHNVRYQAAMYI